MNNTTIDQQLDLIPEVSRLKSSVNAVIDHQLIDQEKLKDMQTKVQHLKSLLLETIAQLNELKAEKEGTDMGSKKEQLHPDMIEEPTVKQDHWIQSDVSLDSEMVLNMNLEMKKHLREAAEEVGCSTGALIRQLIVRQLPVLQDYVGPTKFKN